MVKTRAMGLSEAPAVEEGQLGEVPSTPMDPGEQLRSLDASVDANGSPRNRGMECCSTHNSGCS